MDVITHLSPSFSYSRLIPLSHFTFQENTKRKLEERTAKTLAAKNQKIEMVKNLLESEDSDSVKKVTPATAPKPSRYTLSRMYPAKSEPDLTGQTPSRTPVTHLRTRTNYTQQQPTTNRIVTRNRPKSPPPTKPVSTCVTKPQPATSGIVPGSRSKRVHIPQNFSKYLHINKQPANGRIVSSSSMLTQVCFYLKANF